jgi:hypothetical protein
VLRRRRNLIAIALLAIVPLAACGGGDDEPLSQEEFAEKMTEGDSGVDEETADCVAGVVYDELPEEELDKLTADALNCDEAPSPAIEAVLTDAIGSCLIGDPGGTIEEGEATSVPTEICDAALAWIETADVLEIAIVQGWAQEVGQTTVQEAADFILSEPETETADQQAAFEGAVDVLRSELALGGCTGLE